jgi:hypothetical protein
VEIQWRFGRHSVRYVRKIGGRGRRAGSTNCQVTHEFRAQDLGFVFAGLDSALASPCADSARPPFHKSLLNSRVLRPASLTIPAIVKVLMGLARGIVITRSPSVMVTCFPWRAIQNPAFSNALIACSWFTPGSLGIVYPTST